MRLSLLLTCALALVSQAVAAELLRDRPAVGSFVTVSGQQRAVLESAPLTPQRPFDSVIPSWNLDTPPGSWSTLELRVQIGERWSRYYSFGTWTSQSSPVRSSAAAQADADGQVKVDTLLLRTPAWRLQYRLTLHARPGGVLPSAHLLTFSTDRADAVRSSTTQREAWGTVLEVPRRSQMVFAAGEGWCSPTSLSMVLAYHGLDRAVPEVARQVFDRAYGGTGNWPFNTAYAASLGLEAYVTRLEGMGALEALILQKRPVIASIGFKAGEIRNAPVAWSEGHLLVVVGFDARGNVVVNDPAGRDEGQVRRTYARAEFERAWLRHSRGTVYVLAPRS